MALDALSADSLGGLTSTTAAARPRLPQPTGGTADPARKAAEDFESVFIATMLNSMSSGLEAEAPFGGGNAEQTWRGLENEEVAKQIAATGGVGLADAIYSQLIEIQQGASR
ncbi:Rod binding domain-containing protein [Rhodobium orientis]|uniref:Flagellar protein FlgJ N-terminal domain-containing protein n=1 Tax=Rhodobium orientis TaxID=34017 RepID=A0A327JFE6_9HYPH|nr:rod-binding protein [Rhodobium orientis]MBB4301828.1 Rod binding domain-containing protein [Rhodobium orientis]MBK5948398.1 hypothetical protein [Rhodobium orientis]RAI24661.1 hypothetical protein CH339_21785 [Rhodobium orientis]